MDPDVCRPCGESVGWEGDFDSSTHPDLVKRAASGRPGPLAVEWVMPLSVGDA